MFKKKKKDTVKTILIFLSISWCPPHLKHFLHAHCLSPSFTFMKMLSSVQIIFTDDTSLRWLIHAHLITSVVKNWEAGEREDVWQIHIIWYQMNNIYL